MAARTNLLAAFGLSLVVIVAMAVGFQITSTQFLSDQDKVNFLARQLGELQMIAAGVNRQMKEGMDSILTTVEAEELEETEHNAEKCFHRLLKAIASMPDLQAQRLEEEEIRRMLETYQNLSRRIHSLIELRQNRGKDELFDVLEEYEETVERDFDKRLDLMIQSAIESKSKQIRHHKRQMQRAVSQVGEFMVVGILLVVSIMAVASYLLLRSLTNIKDQATELEHQHHVLQEQSGAIAANKAKSEFLASMSQEIRTPLTAILGFAEAILKRLTTAEDISAVRIIKRNGEYLLRLTNDILDLSKIEVGKLAIERIACSPTGVVDNVASLIRVRAEAKNIPLHIEYVGEIPETIQCDPKRLRQILANLLDNAIEFTESGCVHLVTQLVQGADRQPRLQFEVIDTGIGMPQYQVSKIFQPFTRTDSSTSQEFGGTGLGLAISKQLAVKMGGDVTVSSTLGKGSTFTLTIDTGTIDTGSLDGSKSHPSPDTT